MQGQRLILFVAFVTATYATKINFFGAYANFPIIGNQSTVNADNLTLWANVTDCPAPACSCEVSGNASSNPLPVNFTIGSVNEGHVDVKNLEPDTLYSFVLRCEGASDTVALDVRTDYGRPSPPREIAANLQSGRVHLSWLHPETPAGPIHHYRLKINQNPDLDNLPRDKLFYDMTEDYIYGTRYTFVLSACNTNKEGPVCSDPNQGLITFSVVTPATTTASSANGLSYSILFPVWLLCVPLFR